MATLISVPAGRCIRRDQSKWVDPQPAKGLLQMRLEDDLMRLWWTDIASGASEDELIIFPGEATFEQVEQDISGRTHILKFSSSDQKYFFWFQRTTNSTDNRARVDINALLQDPYYQPGTAPLPYVHPVRLVPPARQAEPPNAPILSSPLPNPSLPMPRYSTQRAPASTITIADPAPPYEERTSAAPAPTSAAGTTEGSSSTSTAPAPAAAPSTSEGTAGAEDMARMLVQWANAGGLSHLSPEDDKTSLRDIWTPANLRAVFERDPTFARTIKEDLPQELNLPDEPDTETLMEILTAPQMTEAVGSLDSALRNGGLPGSMMRDIGLPESAGTGVGAFLDALRALKETGQSGAEDRMDED